MANKQCTDLKEDESVEFFVYPKLLNSSADDKLKEFSKKLYAINDEGKLLSKCYLWHREAFILEPVFGTEVPYFYGKLRFGENIEDEWFLVHVLLELTNKFEDIVVRVKDQDGEFLLIEAAEHLPSWVTPETCEDKVFLHKGHVHIIPLNYGSSDPENDDEEFQVTEEVLELIRRQPPACQVGLAVERPIFDRVGKYPEKLSSLLHHAVVYVPHAVAALLNAEPSLVTAAVRAFCERDLIDQRACRAMKFFPPEQRVFTRVQFTKCSYAMLVSSKYQPDKRTGWNLPLPSSTDYKAHLLGIKLACGFEILLTQAKSRNKNSSCKAEDFSQDRGWHKFLSSLNNINYFRGLLEHSKEHNQLLNAAQDFYRNTCTAQPRKEAGSQILELLDTVEVDVEELKRIESELIELGGEDDSWMDITKEELDAMLAARFGGGDMVDLPNGQPKEIASHLNSFINHVSGIDGVEFPSTQKKAENGGPVRPKRGVKKKKKSVQFTADTKLHSVTSTDQIAPRQNRVTIEPDGFMNAVQNILDFSIPDDNYWESDGSGMSSYEDEDNMDIAGPSPKDKKMSDYLAEMDRQLAGTTLDKSFVKKQKAQKAPKSGDSDSDEELEKVDIDMNALANILMSYKTQMGAAGPAENILGPLGVNLEDIDADVD